MAVEVQLRVRVTTLEILRDALRDKVQALFDDPYGVCETDTEIRVHEQDLIDACADLDMDFWAVACESTTEVERRRLYAITGINP